MLLQLNRGGDDANLLQVIVIHLKENFQSCCDACHLNLSPKLTLIASHAVHNPRHVAEMVLKFLLEDLTPNSIWDPQVTTSWTYLSVATFK